MKAKIIISALLIFVVIAAFFGYKMYHKPHININTTKSDISLTADKILSDFSSDENMANAKYLEKIIEVTATVYKVKIEKGKGIVTLKTNSDFGSVICHLSIEATKKINLIKENNIISLKGICTGFLMDVILIKCEIINQ